MSTDGLTRKKRIRAGHRGSAARMMGRVNDLLAETTDPANRSQLAQLKLSLVEKLETLKQLDAEILELTEEENLEDEIQRADDFKSDLYSAMVKLDSVSSATCVPPTTIAPSTPATRADRIKLPKLSIESFDGEVAKWTPFWDSYDSAIHKNSSLNDVDKFNYLRSLLRGAAREAVAGLMLTSANYHEAIAILRKRFGNKQQIISRHMELLMNVEPVTSHNNVKALRHLHDVVESNVRSLKALDVSADSYGSLLSSVLMNKFPAELRLIISRKVGDDSWNLEVILKELVQEIEARERSAATTASPNSQPRRQAKDLPTTATLFSSNTLPQSQCCFCNQQHPSGRCQTVKGADDRKQALRKVGRCFVCLKRGHVVRECYSKARCSECGGRHHRFICNRVHNTGASSQGQESTSPASSGSDPTRTTGLNPGAKSFQPPTNTLFVGVRNAVLLQTAKVRICDPEQPEQTMEARAILDTGSQQSYATNRVKETLRLTPHKQQSLSMMTFGSNHRKAQICEVVKISVTTRDGAGQELDVFVVPSICQPLESQPIDMCTTRYQHLSDLNLADSPDDEMPLEIDLLIGMDSYWSFVTGEVRRGETGPIAMNTRLGWVLSGVTMAPRELQQSHNLLTHVLSIDASPQPDGHLEEMLQSFWRLESLGIDGSEDCVLEEFNQTVQFKEGHYEVTLPWKHSHPPLPNNYALCQKRLKGLLHRLRSNPEIMREYDAIIQSQLQQGIVEEVAQTDDVVAGRVHYLPHHAVIRKDKKTTKVRIVYDASARSTGCSLNECLHKGPKFEQKILDLLLRFRTYRIALTADIEKAFLMISVHEEDRDVLRFLWVDDSSSDAPNIKTLRFTRVVFGVSSSPFLLNATLQHHLDRYSTSHPDLVKRLTKSTYVDDVVSGGESEEQTYQLYFNSKQVLKKGGFNLRKFVTNSDALQCKIDDEEGISKSQRVSPPVSHSEDTYARETLGTTQATQPGEQKILGVRWEFTTDQLHFGFAEVAQLASGLEPTKRNLVSIVGRFYDPIGFLSPIVIRFKVFFQDLCERRQDWDQPLLEDLLLKWNTLISELQCSPDMSMPRCVWDGITTAQSSCGLYGFCDASKHAYAAVVYLVINTPHGQSVSFITSKTRVSPLKPQTIPRLELLSALLLARLVKTVTDSLDSELNLTQPTCYTDSKVALYWILGVNRVWKQFVQHRVSEIRQLLPVDCWQHCPGTDNPADLPSRGLAPVELAHNMLWIKGPEWLGTKTTSNQVNEILMPAECAEELRVKDRPIALLVTNDDGPGLGRVMNCQDYSCLQKLLCVTSYLLKFADSLKKRGGSDHNPDGLEAKLLAKAESLWIRTAQKQLAADVNFEKLKKQFGLFLDLEGIWRCGGRLSNADAPFHVKHPILLPRSHHLAILVVRRAHERVIHNGVKDTLTEVRSKFWLLKGRAFVKKIVNQCVICRKFEGRPCLGPPPPPLPKFRLEEDPPFTHTGVDFAGPLYVKTSDIVASSKVWICLYTCCVVRAVHLDVVPDMTTSAFIRSLKRFAARRGLPRRFVSDNGKTFEAAAQVIKTIMSSEEVQHYLMGIGVEWSFNLERAPWWGGVFERMVRMTKRCLRKMVGRAKLTYDELSTMVTEVECVINSRPLSCVTPDDLEEPLTPAHLISGRRLLSLPDGIYLKSVEDVEVTAKHLTKRMVYLNRILDEFWRRWRNEYMLELRDSHRYGGKTSMTDAVTVGDIVLVHDDNKPRGFWRIAKVHDLIQGKDGHTRGAILKVVPEGRRGPTQLQRPLQRLYPLEVRSTAPGQDEVPESVPENDEEVEEPKEVLASVRNNTEDVAHVPTGRPKRSAASQARDRAKAMAVLEQDNDSD